jgi:hypothetical protein
MRVKCKQSFTKPSDGFLGFGAHNGKRIEGITENKTYTVMAVNKISGGGNISVSNNIKFLLYNDNGKWELYKPEYFEPA